MKKLLVTMVSLLLVVALAAQQIVINDSLAETRTVTSGFNTIVVTGGIELYLSQYEKESIAVSASKEQYIQYIKTEISNNELSIRYDGPSKWLGVSKKIKVYVSFKTLKSLRSSGACLVKVADTINVPDLLLRMSGASEFKGFVKVNNLSIQLSGASQAMVSGNATALTVSCSGASKFNGFVNVNNLSMRLTGASQAKLSGSTKKLTVFCNGASDLSAYDLSTEFCTAVASGASDIYVSAKSDLYISATGASSVFYKGTAQVKKNISTGASKVLHKD